MKYFYRMILLSVSLLLLSGCQKLNTEELTTQPREYIEETIDETIEEVTEDVDNTADRDSDTDENKIYFSAEEIQKKYPDVDFNQKVLSLSDDIVYYLSLDSRFVEESALSYKEGYLEPVPFYLKVNSAEIIEGMQNLPQYFLECETLNDPDFFDYFGEDAVKNGSYLMINLTIQNKSKVDHKINMGNKHLEVVHDKIGIYRIIESVGSLIDTDYEGSNRGTGRSRNEITFTSGEVITLNVVYFLDEEIDWNSLYYNVNDLSVDGDLYDDGTWHANSEGGPNQIKVVVKNK